MTTFWEIFLEYFWNTLEKIFEKIFKILKNLNTILLTFMLKNWQKCNFQKNSNPFTSLFTI